MVLLIIVKLLQHTNKRYYYGIKELLLIIKIENSIRTISTKLSQKVISQEIGRFMQKK